MELQPGIFLIAVVPRQIVSPNYSSCNKRDYSNKLLRIFAQIYIKGIPSQSLSMKSAVSTYFFKYPIFDA
jgi:hypothetical protein